ncbi:MAG: hypothetical protein H0T73_01375 [Ardenticatenales bacterium]|nr:hypothetical protein [Ardenticatenales bacterium]
MQRDHLLEDLLAQRQAMAQQWQRALTRLEPALQDNVQAAQLLPLVERFLVLLRREPFEALATRSLGAEVAAFSTEPETLICSQEVLARQISEVLSVEELAALQPRLTRLFGEMAAGFYGHTKAEREKEAFSYLWGVRHQSAGDLNMIVGFSRVILKGIDGPVTDLQKKDLTLIYKAGARIVRMMNDLSDMGKIRVGVFELDAEEFDMQELLFQLTPTLRAYQIESRPAAILEVSLGDDLREMQGDRYRVHQVIRYLLQSIICYTDEGTIALAVRRDRLEKDGVFVLEVSSPAASPFKFYQKYWSERTTSARRYWLEYDLLHSLIDLMGGTLTAEGSEEMGSVFTLRLPARMAT